MSSDVHNSDILKPSASSVAVSSFGMVIALLFIVLPRLGSDAFLKLLLGKDADINLLVESKFNYGPAIDQFLGNDLLGRAIVFGVWMFIGLCAFVILMFISGLIRTVGEEAKELEYVHQQKSNLIRNDLIGLVFKIGIAAAWAGFVVICLRFVLSFFAVSGYLAWGEGSVLDWGRFLLAGVILLTAFHIQTIFARLLAGKTRLWESIN